MLSHMNVEKLSEEQVKNMRQSTYRFVKTEEQQQDSKTVCRKMLSGWTKNFCYYGKFLQMFRKRAKWNHKGQTIVCNNYNCSKKSNVCILTEYGVSGISMNLAILNFGQLFRYFDPLCVGVVGVAGFIPLSFFFSGFQLISHPSKLTPRRRVLPEKQTGPQMIKTFPAIYKTRRFITAFTTARHLFVPVLSQIDPTHALQPTA